jgi:hypothetical protein
MDSLWVVAWRPLFRKRFVIRKADVLSRTLRQMRGIRRFRTKRRAKAAMQRHMLMSQMSKAGRINYCKSIHKLLAHRASDAVLEQRLVRPLLE